LALISSGVYIAGAMWPPIFERIVAAVGWRQTMQTYGMLEMAAIIPLAAIFLRAPPKTPRRRSGELADPKPGNVLGWPPGLVYGLLCAASFLCCMPMALPQGHLVAFCSDLGIAPSHGAAMLSVILGIGFLSRQLWGAFSDRAGGLMTLAVCSACQLAALTAFTVTEDEIGLFTIAVFFGLGFSGLVPAYVLALRALFPGRDASWRIPTLLMFSGSGMAAGAWMGGFLYDWFGYYAPAFVAAIGANLINLAIVVVLLLRQPASPHRAFGIA
jgi:predicted MFS family arabinose efflux permease